MRIETKIVINCAFRILNKQNGCVPVKAGFGAVLIHICDSGQHCRLQWSLSWGWLGELSPLHSSEDAM